MIFIHQTLHKNIRNAKDEGVIASVNGLSRLAEHLNELVEQVHTQSPVCDGEAAHVDRQQCFGYLHRIAAAAQGLWLTGC